MGTWETKAECADRDDGLSVDMSDASRWRVYASDGTLLAMIEPGSSEYDADPEASARAWCDAYVESGATEARDTPIEAEEADPREEAAL